MPPGSGKAGQKKDLSIAPITYFYIFAEKNLLSIQIIMVR
jgi:hypothetical protein